jgi:hypothetical protein
MNVTAIWHFLLGACEMMQILVCRERNSSNYAENIRCHHTKCSGLSKHMSSICAA